jgi:hypothetical protein
VAATADAHATPANSAWRVREKPPVGHALTPLDGVGVRLYTSVLAGIVWFRRAAI